MQYYYIPYSIFNFINTVEVVAVVVGFLPQLTTYLSCHACGTESFSSIKLTAG